MGKETRQAIRGQLEKVGGKLSSSEFDKIKERLDVSGKLIRQQAKREDIRLPGQSRADLPGYGSSEAQGMFPAVLDYNALIGGINAQGNIDTQIANLNADAAKYVSQLQTGAQKDIANTQAGATRYVADRELESNLGVENIRAKGAIDLQGIVNAGMERVEGIRGEYGIKGKKVDRSTAILGGLVSAFNF
jgi:hypothetical protein